MHDLRKCRELFHFFPLLANGWSWLEDAALSERSLLRGSAMSESDDTKHFHHFCKAQQCHQSCSLIKLIVILTNQFGTSLIQRFDQFDLSASAASQVTRLKWKWPSTFQSVTATAFPKDCGARTVPAVAALLLSAAPNNALWLTHSG